jgi:hypothetical protein
MSTPQSAPLDVALPLLYRSPIRVYAAFNRLKVTQTTLLYNWFQEMTIKTALFARFIYFGKIVNMF